MRRLARIAAAHCQAALLGMLALLVCACAPSRQSSDDARLVVSQFLTARQSRDLEGAMACFVDQPEMHTGQGVGWTGREAVRAIMAYRLTDTYTVGDLRVSDNHVMWSEHVTRVPQTPPSPGAGRPQAVFDEDVEAVVVGGRIATLTTYVGGAPRISNAAVGPAGTIAASLLLPLMVLVLVAAAVLIWPTSASMRAVSPANGRLMSGLREYVARRG